MKRRPPRSTRTDTLFPYTTLFRSFVAAVAEKLAPGGLLILSTPNRTPLSRLAMITIGESVGGIPKGTHDWHKFINPEELTKLLEDAGLEVIDSAGISFTPGRGFILRSEEHTSELKSLMRISYAVFGLKKKTKT